MDNYILINDASKVKLGKKFQISSKHPMFQNEYLRVKVCDDCITISVPTIDYNGKVHKTTFNNKPHNNFWKGFGITNDTLCEGKFEIDEEDSSEDELVIYID